MDGHFGRDWRHIFKLDPDKSLSDEQLLAIVRSGTDALMISGSSGVTGSNTLTLVRRLHRMRGNEPTSRSRLLPIVSELVSADAAIEGFDYYLIPTVLNTADSQWIHGHHRQALARFADWIPWLRTAAEGYLILNPDCTAAKLTNAETDLDDDQLLACVDLADKLFRLPFLYIEYSGTFGDMNLLKRVASRLTQTQLIYGGGIHTPEQARQAAQCAHTVVVGNALYEHFAAALATVQEVRSTERHFADI